MPYVLTSNSYMVTTEWVKKLSIKSGLKAIFIDTAAEVYDKSDQAWLQADRQALVDAGFTVEDYTITAKDINDLRAKLVNFDIIFVSGGNTFYLLEKAVRSGFLELLRTGFFDEKIYVGSSAGSVLLSDDIDAIKFLDDPTGTQLEDTKAAGIVDAVIFPHWGSQKFKPRYIKAIDYAYDKGVAVLTLADNQFALINQGKFTITTVK